MVNNTSIGIGINIFGEFHRQNLCIESLLRVQKAHSNVKLYNIQQLGLPETTHELFETIYDYGRTASDIAPRSTSSMPLIRDMFDRLAEEGNEYFIFLNSDIILTTSIIKFLNFNKVDSACISRLAIENIETLDDTSIGHSHMQASGFDVFGIKTSWWEANRHLFPEYIYAVSAWDVDFASRLMVLGDCMFKNDAPAWCYHIIHEEKSHNDTPDRKYNIDLFFQKSGFLCETWHGFMYAMLEDRRKYDLNYLMSSPKERTLQYEYFKNENIHSFCTNWS